MPLRPQSGYAPSARGRRNRVVPTGLGRAAANRRRRRVRGVAERSCERETRARPSRGIEFPRLGDAASRTAPDVIDGTVVCPRV